MSKNDDAKLSNKTRAPKKNNSLQGFNPSTLKNVRIIQKHLVYVIGLSSNLANKDTLSKPEYFGQYGTIIKVVVNKNKAYNPDGPNGPSYSAYISYSTPLEASIAILSIDNIEADEHILRASFGTTKYCTFFLKNCDCPNKDCLYLHSIADEGDIICRDDMNSNKNIFYEQQLLAIKLADLFNAEIRKKLCSVKKHKSIFPSTELLYSKDIVIENDPESSYSKKFNSDGYYNSNRFKKKYEYEDYNESIYTDYQKTQKASSAINCMYDNQNEEIEYILVRDKGDKYKKNKNRKTFSSKNDFYKNKVKSEDDSVLPDRTTNNNSDNCQTTSLSGGENSSKNFNETNLNNSKNENLVSNNNQQMNVAPVVRENTFSISKELNSPLKNIFRRRDNSRFEFVNKTAPKMELKCKESSTNEVPEFVTEMLYKKISRFTFFKKFSCVKNLNDDLNLFEKELRNNNNNSWAQFIKINSLDNNNNIANSFDFIK